MPRFDLSFDELASYDPRLEAPSDLDAFWEQTLSETRSHPLDPVIVPAESPLTVIESYDVSWRGFGGDAIRGWLHLPAARVPGDGPPPAVVQYQGYGGGRGLVFENVFWQRRATPTSSWTPAGRGAAGRPGTPRIRPARPPPSRAT